MIFHGFEFLGIPHLHENGCGKLAWIQLATTRLVRADMINDDERTRCMSCGALLE